MVPVLSSTTVSTRCAVSRLSPDLMRIPCSAPRPVPTIMAVGVARPSAHGQEITSTAIPDASAKLKVAPDSSQTMIVITAMVITTGTKIPLTLSASLAMGALLPPASSTNRMICDNVVSSPIRSAFIWKYPARLTVAPVTRSPAFFSTGMLSPVIADSSTVPVPSRITPSTGIPCPGFTITVSPTCT